MPTEYRFKSLGGDDWGVAKISVNIPLQYKVLLNGTTKAYILGNGEIEGEKSIANLKNNNILSRAMTNGFPFDDGNCVNLSRGSDIVIKFLENIGNEEIDVVLSGKTSNSDFRHETILKRNRA